MDSWDCNCAPARVVRDGTRWEIPLNRDLLDNKTLRKYMGMMEGTSVYFGSKRGFSIQELVDTPIRVLASLIPDKETKPFQTYTCAPDLFPFEMKIQWPNHGPETYFKGRIPLHSTSGAAISAAELAQWIAHAVQTVLYNCRASYTGGEDEHCCWLVGLDNDPFGLTSRDIYLVRLRHIGALTFVPELHVEPRRAPYSFPEYESEAARRAVEDAPRLREAQERAEWFSRIRRTRWAKKAYEQKAKEMEEARIDTDWLFESTYQDWICDEADTGPEWPLPDDVPWTGAQYRDAA